jgi:hypothetical protein
VVHATFAHANNQNRIFAHSEIGSVTKGDGVVT